MKTIPLISEQSRKYAIALISELPMDGSKALEIKNADTSPTILQQRLWFVWCGQVAVSGIGSDDTKNDVHISSKWRFVRPILLVQDELFAEIYNSFMEKIKGSVCYSEFCKGFADQYIHTGSLTRKQRAESLTEFKNYWVEKGVCLSDPDDYGKNLLQYR